MYRKCYGTNSSHTISFVDSCLVASLPSAIDDDGTDTENYWHW